MARDHERRKTNWGLDEKKPEVDQGPTAEQLDQKMHDAKILMEQTHQLYLQYFNRVEKRPPTEKVRLLETKINELQRNMGSTGVTRFKVTQLIALYRTFKDLWERKLRQLETK